MLKAGMQLGSIGQARTVYADRLTVLSY